MGSRTRQDRFDRALIRTKLTPPSVRPGLVERSRLLQRLDEALGHRLTLVSAPPGFGKTTVVTQWLERCALPSVWLALDGADSDPERFVRYLVTAVEGATSLRFEEATALLASRTAPPFDVLCEVLLSELSALDEPLVLALEDYHAVDSEVVHHLVEKLVQALPAPLHLVILTRVDPPWPLARWRAQEWLLDLRVRDLRFSVEEAQAFFAGGQAHLTVPTVELLHARTEGWAAALRLVELSLRDSPDPEARARQLSGSTRVIADYLIDEVLAVQPAEVREFLEATAPLPRFCASLCDHVLADQARPMSGRAGIDHLLRENLFLVPLDAGGEWYRYHHLFRDLLMNHLPALSRPESRAEIDRRAAEWFAREGLIEDALHHWIASGDLDAAAGLVGERLLDTLAADLSRQAVSRWLVMFPPGAERGRLPLLLAHAHMKTHTWDLAGLAALLDEAEEILRAPARAARAGLDAVLDADVHATRAFVLYWTGDPTGALEYASRALDDLPPHASFIVRAQAIVYKAGALALLGRRTEGGKVLDDAVAAVGSSDGRSLGVLLTAQALFHLYAAEIGAVDVLAQRILTSADRAPMADYWVGHAHYLRAIVAYERNRLDEAASGFGRVSELRYRVSTRLAHDALIGLTLVARARGDEAAVARQAADARTFTLQVGDPTSLRVADSFEVRLALNRAAQERPRPPSPTPGDAMSYWLEVPSVTHAEALLREPSSEAGPSALPVIERQLEQAEARHNVRQAIPFALLRAMALDGLGRRDTALDALASVVTRAEPLGFVRTFLDRGPSLIRLLEALAARDGRSRHLDALLSASAGVLSAGTSTGLRDAADTGLSNRELDVLELLAERLTNKEIAERLHVSPETVKFHASRVYQKLGATGRREAVTKAVAAGLIRLPR